MKATPKNIIREIINNELYRLKTELTPHFEDCGKLYISGNDINLMNGMIYSILSLNDNGTIDNDYKIVYDMFDLKPEDIFDKIGTELEEITIKTINNFNINNWISEFAKINNLEILNGCVYLNDDIVINAKGDVNYRGWHFDMYKDCHAIFKFNGDSTIIINSHEKAEEYERVFKIMINYINKLKNDKPNINKIEVE